MEDAASLPPAGRREEESNSKEEQQPDRSGVPSMARATTARRSVGGRRAQSRRAGTSERAHTPQWRTQLGDLGQLPGVFSSADPLGLLGHTSLSPVLATTVRSLSRHTGLHNDYHSSELLMGYCLYVFGPIQCSSFGGPRQRDHQACVRRNGDCRTGHGRRKERNRMPRHADHGGVRPECSSGLP